MGIIKSNNQYLVYKEDYKECCFGKNKDNHYNQDSFEILITTYVVPMKQTSDKKQRELDKLVTYLNVNGGFFETIGTEFRKAGLDFGLVGEIYSTDSIYIHVVTESEKSAEMHREDVPLFLLELNRYCYMFAGTPWNGEYLFQDTLIKLLGANET